VAGTALKFPLTELQPLIWKRLARIHRMQRVGSAYLFSGPPGSGKEPLAIAFAQLLNCEQPEETPCGACGSCVRFRTLQHEHLKLVVPLPTGKASGDGGDVLQSLTKPDLKELMEAIQEKARQPFYKIRLSRASRIRIDSIRELRHTLYLKMQNPGHKVVLIFDAHLLSAGQGEAANALLKILEEPPDHTTLILVTDHKADLLPTILSRCQQIDFPPLKTRVVEAVLAEELERDQAAFIAGVAHGDMHRALSLAQRAPGEVADTMRDLIHTVLNPRSETWRRFVVDHTRLAKTDPEEYRFRLYLLQLWFRGAYRLRRGLPDELHQDGFREEMQTLNEHYPRADFVKINTILEEGMEALAQNRYLPLTLINLLISIQHGLCG
jgi:DNA polymerase-3 subunit delta'